MHIPRLLLLSLLVPVFVAHFSAQSLPNKNLVSSRPLRDGLITPPEFRMNVPTLKFQGQPSDERPEAIPKPQAPQLEFYPQTSALEQGDAVCLSLRTYRVVRDDPKSDSTRPAGYSECQPAARYQIKTTVDTQELVLR